MIFFTIYDVFAKMLYDGDGRTKPEIQNRVKKQRKKFPVWLPSHLRFYEMEADCFLVSVNTENKPDYPKLERVPNLMGQKQNKKQVWEQYGQLMTDNMNFMCVKFQDLQQKRAGVRVEVQK